MDDQKNPFNSKKIALIQQFRNKNDKSSGRNIKQEWYLNNINLLNTQQ